MMQSITKSQMQKLDRQLINSKYNSSFELLRYAGKQIAKKLMNHLSSVDNVVIVCGLGNNGGDGLVMGEYLIKHNIPCSIFILNNQRCSNDNDQQQEVLSTLNIPVHVISEDLDFFIQQLNYATHVVDALYGIGFKKSIDQEGCKVIDVINKCNKQVISIDINSGLYTDSGFKSNACVNSHITYAIGAYKPAHFLFDGLDVVKKVELVDIGISLNQEDTIETIKQHEIKVVLPTRKMNVHKYMFKHVCVIGGSPSMMGAPALTISAALRSGCGLVSYAMAHELVKYKIPLPYEVMTPHYGDQQSLKEILVKKDVVVYGNGVSKQTPNIDVLSVIFDSVLPFIIDGDGLYHLSLHQNLNHQSRLILTPHLNELSILANTPIETIKKDVVSVVKEVAKKYNATVLLKGPTTIVCHNDKISIFECGHSGLASAGTGDVFAGILASMVGLFDKTMDAILATLKVYHQASILAKEKHGIWGMIASDVINELPHALEIIDDFSLRHDKINIDK